MTDYVFDTEPLIAYFYDEPGASEVADRLRLIEDSAATGAISHATATELVYKIARLETGDPNHSAPDEEHVATGERDLRVLRGFGVTVETPSWSTAARIKAAGGISLGDSYGAALAADLDAAFVVGADPEFDDLAVDVELDRIRADPS
ncbi:MAG: PIN domain-containing protein [Haloarculaceae archaeon]